MKFLILLSAFFFLTLQADAFAPSANRLYSSKLTILGATQTPSQNNSEDSAIAILSRREAMLQGATTSLSIAALALVASPESAMADIYDEQEKERKRKQKEDSENARKLVPAILLGGTALTVPFFLPNLIRLGKKFISLGEDDGYGGAK